MMKSLLPYCVGLLLCLSWHSYALDTIRYNKAPATLDQRDHYPLQVLTLALDKTLEHYGPYEIQFSAHTLKRSRALRELYSGRKLNVYSAPSQKKWEDALLPIYFPIYKGLLNYRRLLINQQDTQKFAKITELAQLKKLRSGLGQQWSTTQVLRENNFNIVTSSSYEGLFGMLRQQRFDYYLRGINEIYGEFESRKMKYPNMRIEEHIVLNLPLPVFLFVSPKNIRLHQRIKEGLWIMHLDGSFDALFQQYHQDALQQTQLIDKKIFYIENKLLNPHAIYNDKSLWISFSEH